MPITNWLLNEHIFIQSFENLPKSRRYSVILIAPENIIKIKGPGMMGFILYIQLSAPRDTLNTYPFK